MTGLAFPEISPIIFSIGPIAIRWYSMAYLTGILFAWWMISKDVKKYKLSFTRENVEDIIFYVTLGIILGGRVGYMLVYGTDLLIHNPLSIFAIWNGGMSFHGGIIGVIVALFMLSKKMKKQFLSLTDMVCVYVPVGICLGRLANFVNGELWGRPSEVAWAIRFPAGGYVPRHPSQIYESLTEGLLLFIILFFCWKVQKIRIRTGLESGIFLCFYGVFRFFMEFFREPDIQIGYIFKYITMGQILSLPFVLCGIYLIVKSTRTVR